MEMGRAPTHSTSFTFIATQSIPIVSKRSNCSATRIFVPTPSVEMAMPISGVICNTFAKYPIGNLTGAEGQKENVWLTHSATFCMPSSSLAVSTPVALYVAWVFSCLLVLGTSICSRHCGQHRDVNTYRFIFTQTLSCDANLLKTNSPVVHNAMMVRCPPD